MDGISQICACQTARLWTNLFTGTGRMLVASSFKIGNTSGFKRF